MNNSNDDGKEFIQGIFRGGQSFGEPPLFCGLNYQANAEVITTTILWLLPKKIISITTRSSGHSSPIYGESSETSTL